MPILCLQCTLVLKMSVFAIQQPAPRAVKIHSWTVAMTLPDTLQSSTLFIAKPRRGKPFASIKAKWRFLVPLLTPLLILLVWHVITARALYPAFIIPPPADVAHAFVEAMEDGRLPKAFGVTFSQVMIGLSIGALLGLSLGYVLGCLPILETLLAPLMIAFQSTPVVAYGLAAAIRARFSPVR
jgi:hypothetical protein